MIKNTYPILVLLFFFISIFGYAQGETGNHLVLQAVLPDNSTSTFDTWKAALAYANKQERCTLRLLDDIDLDTLKATQYVNKELVLDLNGHTLRAKATAKFSRLFVTNYDYSSLTIQSAFEGGCISFTSSDSSSVYAVYAYKGAVVMRDVKIECMNYAGVLWQYTDGIWTQLLTDNEQVENDADKGQYSSASYKAHKRITNGHLYIISGDKVFTPLGGRIKRL